MVRSELLKKLCDLYPNILRRDMEKILEVIFSEISKALRGGRNIEIRGFGTYKIAKRKARIGRNPKNSKLFTGSPDIWSEDNTDEGPGIAVI